MHKAFESETRRIIKSSKSNLFLFIIIAILLAAFLSSFYGVFRLQKLSKEDSEFFAMTSNMHEQLRLNGIKSRMLEQELERISKLVDDDGFVLRDKKYHSMLVDTITEYKASIITNNEWIEKQEKRLGTNNPLVVAFRNEWKALSALLETQIRMATKLLEYVRP